MLIPVWGRIKVLRLFLKHIDNFPPFIDMKLLFVLSPEDPQFSQISMLLCDHDIVLATNTPLGDKMNNGIRLALKFDWDYLVNIGSDDIILSEYWPGIKHMLYSGVDVIGMRSIFAYDIKRDQAQKLTYSGIWGGGRCIRRKLVKKTIKLFGGLYPLGAQRGLDHHSYQNMCKAAKFAKAEVHEPYLIDIKTKDNLNSYEACQGFVTITATPADVDFSGLKKEYENKETDKSRDHGSGFLDYMG